MTCRNYAGATAVLRSGLTLFEVGVSLLIVGVSITSALLLFPVGLKAQQESRFRLLAAAQLQSVLSCFSESRNIVFGSEGNLVTDRVYNNTGMVLADLDAAGWYTKRALSPVPPDIAARIDSDGDEIANLLAEGGELFFPSLLNASWIAEGRQPPEQLKLVIGVLGFAQQNALMYHPQIKWPYYEHHPVNRLPVSGGQEAEVALINQAQVMVPGLTATWSMDALSTDPVQLTSAVKELGIDLALVTPPAPDIATIASEYANDPLKVVTTSLVLRWAAFELGRVCRSTNGGFATGYPDADPDIRAFQMAEAWQQAYQTWLQAYQPYDWRIPRDFAFQLFVDAPLLQFDVTVPPLKNPNAGSGIMHSWRILASEPVVALRSHSYGGPIESGSRSAGDGWNLTAPFDPSERCRLLVVWSVDWQSYADAERAPAAPMDAAMLPRLPRNNEASSWTAGSPGVVAHKYAGDSAPPTIARHWTDATRNTVMSDVSRYTQYYMTGNTNQNRIRGYLGRHGLDANGNHRLDVGPTDPSLRLRATTIARFVVYDPRGYLQVR